MVGRAWVLMLAVLAGCARLGYSGAQDARPAADVGGASVEVGPVADGAAPQRDGPPPDGPPRDGPASPDGPPRDGPASSDGPPRDGPAPPPPDGPVPDGPPPPDGPAPPDGLPPAGACVPPATEIAWQPNMVACDKSGGTTFCNAAERCNAAAGWHLCTASEYRARGGAAAGPPSGDQYWLAACVRDGAAPFAPQDHVCATDCTPHVGSSVKVSWACQGGGTISTGELFVGVWGGPTCHRVGVDDMAQEAFWWATPANVQGRGALCCR